MKKTLLFIAILFSACNYVDLNKSFIIGSAERLDKDHCRFYLINHMPQYAVEVYFVDSANKFQVGDTIKHFYK